MVTKFDSGLYVTRTSSPVSRHPYLVTFMK
jgi:hypothetical protein